MNRPCAPDRKPGLPDWRDSLALSRDFGFVDSLPIHLHRLHATDVLDAHSPALAGSGLA